MDASEFQLVMKGYDPNPNADIEAYSAGPVKTNRSIVRRFLQGAGDNQMTVLFAQDSDDVGTAEIPASGTVSIDLQTALDQYTNALGMTDTLLIFVEHKSDSLSSGMHMEANAVNGFTNLLSATAALMIPPGSFRAFGDFLADAMVVGGTNKVLDLNNDDGSNTAGYRIEVCGRI